MSKQLDFKCDSAYDVILVRLLIVYSEIFSPCPLTFFADILWDHYNSPAYISSLQDNTPNESSWNSQDEIQCSADSGIEASCPAKMQARSQDESLSKEANSPASSPEKRSRKITNQIKSELKRKLDAMKFIGRFIAACIAEGWYINLLLSKPFIKQVSVYILLAPILDTYNSSFYITAWIDDLKDWTGIKKLWCIETNS